VLYIDWLVDCIQFCVYSQQVSWCTTQNFIQSTSQLMYNTQLYSQQVSWCTTQNFIQSKNSDGVDCIKFCVVHQLTCWLYKVLCCTSTDLLTVYNFVYTVNKSVDVQHKTLYSQQVSWCTTQNCTCFYCIKFCVVHRLTCTKFSLLNHKLYI
jgi:hypothetical protein